MTDELKVMLNNETLATLLRSNLSCHANKIITTDNLDEIVCQIIESIEYFLNKSDEN